MGLEKPLSYVSGVSGFTPTTVKAALDALAGVRISDMGSNANGTYVRWENGLQVCWQYLAGTYQNAYYMRALWSFPVSFTAAPTVVHAIERPRIAGRDDPYDINYNQYIQPWPSSASSTALFDVIVPSGACVSGDNFNVCAIAIGKWK
jgi:hypothetical protein